MTVSLYKPRHLADRFYTDARPDVRCSVHPGMRGARATTCADGMCPLHAPQAYADHMARHAANYAGENFGATL